MNAIVMSILAACNIAAIALAYFLGQRAGRNEVLEQWAKSSVKSVEQVARLAESRVRRGRATSDAIREADAERYDFQERQLTADDVEKQRQMIDKLTKEITEELKK